MGRTWRGAALVQRCFETGTEWTGKINVLHRSALIGAVMSLRATAIRFDEEEKDWNPTSSFPAQISFRAQIAAGARALASTASWGESRMGRPSSRS